MSDEHRTSRGEKMSLMLEMQFILRVGARREETEAGCPGEACSKQRKHGDIVGE